MSYSRRMPSTSAPGRPLPLADAPSDACCPPGSVLLPTDEAERLASLFKALSDPVRVRLLRHIVGSAHGTACACHLPTTLGISQPTLSHHLKKLTEAGLVTREQRGRWAHYTVRPEAIARLGAFLADTRAD